MTQAPLLTDRRALTHHRTRASAFFLQEELRGEVKDRLTEINRPLTKPAVVTGFPTIWGDFGPVIPDAPILDFPHNDHDLVLHMMGLHWADDLVGQLIQCRHALRPDGLFLGVLFGGQTLVELRACLAEAEVELTGGLSPRVAPMAEIRDLGGLLQRAGFALPVADSFRKEVLYRDAQHLMHDLRAMGEGNALAGRRRTLTPARLLNRAGGIYQDRFSRPDGRVVATFEIIFLTGWAPDASQQKPQRPGSAGTRLADALQTLEQKLPREIG